MRILVLGAAAGGGFPQWNCNCPNCRRARAGDPAATPRTQSSVAVSADGERWVLLNASPDLRQQINDNPELHPKHGARHTPVAAVVLTNGDVDHVAGLLNLRERQPLALYATGRILDVLSGNPMFQVLAPEAVDRRPVRLGAATMLHDAADEPLGLEIEMFAVPGKVALYLEDPDAADFGSTPEDTVGVRVRSTASDGAGFFYIPGCAAMPPELADRLRDAALVLFDGTLWRDDEMLSGGTGVKTGGRMGHLSISGPDGSMAAFRSLDVARKVFIHLNNTNPVLLTDSPERQAVEAAGWQVAHDGMRFDL